MTLYRKIIRIRAEDSPNVRFALAQKRAGLEPTDEVLIPGILRWSDYLLRRATWDPIRQCVGLDGQFYRGAEVLLYPPLWLNRAEQLAEAIRGRQRIATGIGIDTAEGGDRTAMTAVDDWGIIEQLSKKTPDTNVIIGETIAFGTKHGCPPEKWAFDRGGGGKEHADRLRNAGFAVQTVAFGEAVALPVKFGRHTVASRRGIREEKYVYKNMRALLYGELREAMDPAEEGNGFAIPAELTELRRQLAPMPLLYDDEGRMFLPPKRRTNNSKVKSLEEILGCSPDEADSTVLAKYARDHKAIRALAGAF